MGFIALLMVLRWQLGLAIWKWFEIYELMASIVLLMVLIVQLDVGIWTLFTNYELMGFIALPMVLRWQLGLAIWKWFEIYELMASTVVLTAHLVMRTEIDSEPLSPRVSSWHPWLYCFGRSFTS